MDLVVFRPNAVLDDVKVMAIAQSSAFATCVYDDGSSRVVERGELKPLPRLRTRYISVVRSDNGTGDSWRLGSTQSFSSEMRVPCGTTAVEVTVDMNELEGKG